jgi:hypothetical protein
LLTWWSRGGATQALVSGLVNDALAVLAMVGEMAFKAKHAEAVTLLALVAGQDVEPGKRPRTWQIARRVADGCRRVPYRDIERNDLWWSLRVATINLRRPWDRRGWWPGGR